MRIRIEEEATLRPKLPDDSDGYGFGVHFTDRILMRHWFEHSGWDETAKIEGVDKFPWMHPGTSVLHYSGEIFEGLKAYRTKDDKINLFRPEMNAARLNRSATRMNLPIQDEDEILQMIRGLVKEEQNWVPRAPNTSLYIRPTLISIAPQLGVHPSDHNLFYVMLSLAGDYFPGGFRPLSLMVEERDRRAVVGGTGDVKTGGNYAASMRAGALAREKGFNQVLWLDAINGKYLEEAGAMNVAVVVNRRTILTPPLTGSILPGVTRDSVLRMASDLGYKAREQKLEVGEVIRDIRSREVTEVVAMGTAATIASIGILGYGENKVQIGNGEVGPVATKLRQTLLGIQYGNIPDPYGWVVRV